MCATIRNQKPGNYVEKVTLPGDHAQERAQKLRKDGYLELEDEIYFKLKTLGK